MKISIILGTYNNANFLPGVMECIRAQTFHDYEFIIVDNGSTDNTAEVVKNYTWDKVVYVKQNNTGSIAGSRNGGIRVARGEYVSFIDTDDYWMPNKLAETVNVLEQYPQIDFHSHGFIVVDEQDQVFNQSKLIRFNGLKEGIHLDILRNGNFIAGSATTVRTKKIKDMGGFDECTKYRHAEDFNTWLNLALDDTVFYLHSDYLAKILFHRDNLSADVSVHSNSLLTVINEHLFKGKYGLLQKHQILSSAFLAIARNWQVHRGRAQANKNFIRSLMYYPFNWRAWFFGIISIFGLEPIIAKLGVYKTQL